MGELGLAGATSRGETPEDVIPTYLGAREGHERSGLRACGGDGYVGPSLVGGRPRRACTAALPGSHREGRRADLDGD